VRAEAVEVAAVAQPDASDRAAIGVMGRDPVEALEMIAEREDRGTLNLLLKMLEHPGGDDTDGELSELSALFVEPVRRRIAQLEAAGCEVGDDISDPDLAAIAPSREPPGVELGGES
jgi:hypothetical protein